ncbi:Serpentine Receptor, class H [Caenorhabditis elegans]|uniref:Serpentine Receptor, class H n=1 Tax=Caenorhabditis elegans TaxID=6239 RepID=O45794_CAEEL|nr:Serpentine Receptor, class H [Caenorhabditis elegans]CAB07488.1 Serpentine Receptor, class H [Caenorhabditis elegans]|eukprot:NP_507362.1 Serpentine Receptor, class H [Caenorhabditis elegans]
MYASSYFASPEFLVLATHLVTCFEIPTCIYGAYCIQSKTPEKMKSVKWLMLNIHFWSTVSDLTICLIGVPYLHLPCIAVHVLGFFDAPGELLYVLVTFLGALGVSIIIIYENRFYTIIGPDSIWHYIRKVYLPLMYIFPLTFTLPIWAVMPIQENARPCDEALQLENIQMESKKIFIISVDPIISVTWGVTNCILIVTPIITFFTLTFFQLLENQKTHKYSYQTIQLQKTFLLSMSIQFGSFFVIIFIPVLLLHGSVIFWYHDQVLNNFITIMFSSFGTGSTVVMIVVYKPYRRFTFSVFFGNKQKVSRRERIVANM